MARVANQTTGFASSCSLNKAFIDLYQYSKVLRYMLAFKNIVSFFYLWIHSIPLGRTRGGGGAGGGVTALSEVYLSFFLFSVAVRSSLAHILRQV